MGKDKDKKNNKKGKSGKGAAVTLSGALLILIAFLLGKGAGFGFGNSLIPGGTEDVADQSDDSAHEIIITESVTVTEKVTTSEQEPAFADIHISGSSYLYENREYTLTELLDELDKRTDIFTVRVTEDNASQKALSELETELNNKKINFIEDIPEI